MAEFENNQNGDENFPLNPVPGTGVHQPEDSQVVCISEDAAASCCSDKYHRKLAIAAIVCGFSCCGVLALFYSVKAENADKAEKAKRTTDKKSTEYLQRAKKWGIVSIVTWVSLLVLASLVLVVLLLLDCTQLGESLC